MSLTKPVFIYGTSGFRANSQYLNDVVLRTAYYTGVYSIKTGKTIGLMITASHNPPEDNGVKVIDWTGGMLPISCEAELTNLVNSPLSNDNLMNYNSVSYGNVIIGTDTRESSPLLLLQALKGLQKVNATSIVFHNHTTPQIHFIVRAWNNHSFADPLSYVTRFCIAVDNFLNLLPLNTKNEIVYVDCANGVGALWAKKYFKNIKLINADPSKTQNLNHLSGADYVKIFKKFPCGFEEVEPGSRCASFDGDADRIVYYSIDKNNFILMDGDYISALFAIFISEQLKELSKISNTPTFSFGIVQTAYSNGNSMLFFKNKLKIEPLIVKTGVKYLEEAAHSFDIGIYFEANGHGTVCFSSEFISFLNSYNIQENNEIPRCVILLKYFSHIVNEVVGDGIADLLAVECLLRYYNWSIMDWKVNTFESFPNVQIKVSVKDRTRFISSEKSETILVSPADLQDKINSIVAEYDNARAFLRASGTEPIVRIYAEGTTQIVADCIAKRLKNIILNDF